MTTATNAKKLKQLKSRFSLIVEQILAFALSTNLVKAKKFLQSLNESHNDVLHPR